MQGQNLGHYTIGERIGKGGMGEVYRGTDTRLSRQVAVKVLPELFAYDAERLTRFKREAQVLASLNHPNIAAIYGLEETEGRRALVMELVEGETLADRMGRGPMPLDTALAIAKQIAEGLEEAHDRGFVHRDLKPANVMVSDDGVVKLLDFGLAKALEGEATQSSPSLSMSPTLSGPATVAGVVLGTAAYMSPEQARGQTADRRADIWSFGVVLYEMLSGRKAFVGDTFSDVMASVLKSEVDWEALPSDLPPTIRTLVQRCLVKDRKRRLQSIGEARIVIEEHLTGVALTQSGSRAAAVPVAEPPRWRSWLPWAIAGIALAVTAAALVVRGAPVAEAPLHLSVEVAEQPLFAGLGSSLVLSPDGTRLAYVEGESNQTLAIRPLGQLTGTVLVAGSSGSDSPYNPFFSPDGTWIGFVTPTELRKVPINGGTPLTLCKVQRSRGATWVSGDIVVFAPSPSSGLFRVPAAGGDPTPLTTLDEARKELTHRWPQALPNGKAVIFTSHTQSGGFESATIEAVTLETGERKVLLTGGTYARYVPAGFLVYINQGTIFAVPFDADALEVTGSPAPLVQEVGWSNVEGGAEYSVSDTGRLIYSRGRNAVPQYPVLWVDRKGGTSSLLGDMGSYANPRLSPDGTRLALTVLRDGNWDVWVYDLERRVSTRLTFDEAVETEQVWSPDGEFIIYASDREGPDSLYRRRADGSGDAERLTTASQPQWPTSWSADGRFVTFITQGNRFDIGVLSLEGKAEPEVFLNSPFSESNASFSPDGRWVAYQSDESGRTEVYVRPFRNGGGKWQVSNGGGGFPRWSSSGRELFFQADEGMMVTQIEASGDSFRAGRPDLLFEGAFLGGPGGLDLAGYSFASYDVTGDGTRFVMFPRPSEALESAQAHAVLVTGWFDELASTFAGTAR